MQNIALERGGWCLSPEYFNSSTKLWWQCGQGHIFWMLCSDVKQNHWCPKCGKKRGADLRRGTIDQMYELAKKKKGKCLSKTYTNSQTKLHWQCKEGHEWDAAPAEVKRGKWCSCCRKDKPGYNRKLTIDEMQELARKKNGKCLSTEYVNRGTKLQWQCSEGHEWFATPDKIKQGRWCPRCRTPSVGERICREYFEMIFSRKFPSQKPRWLLNSSGNKMELDGYCPNLKLAFEYQGRQHYEPNAFSMRETFVSRNRDDTLKEKLCKQNGVTLIIIPHTIRYKEIQTYIINECRKNGVKLPNHIKPVHYEFLNVYRLEKIMDMQELAELRGGKCLSKVYVNNRTKLKWQCKEGHIWEAASDHIKSQGCWCPRCRKDKSGYNLKLTIVEMQELAKEKGGKCLSEKYVNDSTKLEWECENGHRWMATPHGIKIGGTWCPECYKLGVKGMKKYNRNYKEFPHKHSF